MGPLPEGLERLSAWSRAHWPGGDPGELALEPVPADGSTRSFVRLSAGGLTLVGLYAPENPAENRAWSYLAGHLAARGIPVAEVLAAEPQSGFFLMRDLGRTSLEQMALALGNDGKALRELYLPVLEILARLQRFATPGFDDSICFDGRELNPEFLLKREAGYFMAEFVSGACGLAESGFSPRLGRDLGEICRLAGRAGPRGLVHRDFQSRNIVMAPEGPHLVDFQGARLGPAQYDLASLLHDPYVNLPWELRNDLSEDYQEIRSGLGEWDRERFAAGMPYVSLSRVMQALGAYAFLSRKMGKAKFAPHVKPALGSLKTLAAQDAFTPFRAFRELVESLPDDPGPEAFAYVDGKA